MSSGPVVEMRDVHLSFGEQHILEGLDLVVQPKERLVVLGRSGGGKSTILRLILGILQPQKGVISFRGAEINRQKRRRLSRLRQRIGMVYQYSALISSLSVRDNLALPLEELTSKTTAEIDKIVAERLDWVGMADAREKKPSELSGGMRKRISLARALVNDPELILYDEPNAGLDPVTSNTVDELMISLSERIGATSVIVTHELGSAFKVGTRIAMLYEGKILADGTPEEFRHHHNPIVAGFIAGEAVEGLAA